MVGVPGRSKACNTCRKRRVKCDEGKPECLRCVKGSFKCTGYERERLWRNASSAPFLEQANSKSKQGNEVAAIRVQPIVPNYRHLATTPQEMSLVAFQENIYQSFMFSNHVWRSSGVLWLEQAAGGKLGQLSLLATQALSQANFGRSHHHSVIETRGIVLYGQCLKSLAGELASAKPSPWLIIPILVLLTHAGSQSDLTGAVFHLRGLARLLHICGPTAFQQQPLLNAFEAARAIMVVGGLIGKQRLFFDAEEWRTIPWIRNTSFKTPQSELLDILVMIPGILHDYAAMDTSNSLEDPLYRDLLERTEMHLVSLFRWRWRWHLRSGHEVCLETVDQVLPSNTFEPTQRLHFGRFVLASEMMLYNAVLMWLLGLVLKIDPSRAVEHIGTCVTAAMPPNNPIVRDRSFTPLRRPSATITLQDAALEICRVFEWVTRHHYSSKESTYLYLFPVGMAMTALQDDPVNMAWIKALLSLSPVTASYANTQGQNQSRFGFYLNSEALLAPDRIRAQGTSQMFSPHDMQHLSG